MKRCFSILAAAVLLLVAAASVAGDLMQECAAVFRHTKAVLDELEAKPHAQAVSGEILLARETVEEGFGLLKARKIEAAAVLAERLPLHLSLIRALMRLEDAAAEGRRLEEEIARMKDRLERLRKRRDKLLLERDGKELSFAYPGRSDATGR